MKFDPERAPASKARRSAAAAAGMRNRLIFMALMLALVLAAMFTALYQSRKMSADEAARLPEARSPSEVIAVPPFDVAHLGTLVRDGTEAERVRADEEGLALLLEHARRLTPVHLRAMGIRTLAAEAAAELAADPGAHRAQPFRVRGWVERLFERTRPGRNEVEHHGTLRTADGLAAHFVVAELGDRASEGSFLLVDGLFLKIARVEGAEGWIEAPLLVGPRAQRSYPATERGGSAEDFPGEILATVIDDSLHEIAPPPEEAFWELMAWARALGPGAVDWAAAPELDGQVMGEILDDGRSWRGRAIRLPVVRNQGTWIEEVGENPARIERVTKGWIGSWEWQRGGVIHFVLPFAAPELERATTITGRGFFFRNHAYEARDGGLRSAPMFVMHSVDVFVPPESAVLAYTAWTVGSLLLVLVVIFAVLLRRDRRRSAELHAELVRRRRARRGSAPAASGGGERS
jgi:hypothetical protein